MNQILLFHLIHLMNLKSLIIRMIPVTILKHIINRPRHNNTVVLIKALYDYVTGFCIYMM